jgi:apolipoprotein N-acyltransferase
MFCTYTRNKSSTTTKIEPLIPNKLGWLEMKLNPKITKIIERKKKKKKKKTRYYLEVCTGYSLTTVHF